MQGRSQDPPPSKLDKKHQRKGRKVGCGRLGALLWSLNVVGQVQVESLISHFDSSDHSEKELRCDRMRLKGEVVLATSAACIRPEHEFGACRQHRLQHPMNPALLKSCPETVDGSSTPQGTAGILHGAVGFLLGLCLPRGASLRPAA